MRNSGWCISLALVLALGSCNLIDGDDGPCPDSDGDGLSDCQEASLGTSPFLVDTDGDGFSDGEEVLELGFNPERNNYKFNPVLSDIPVVEIRIISPPDIRMFFTDASTETVTRSDSSEKTTIRTETDFESTRTEIDITARAGGGAPPSIVANFNKTTNKEHTETFTEEQRTEHSESLSRTASKVLTGGELAVVVEIVNGGNIAYTVDNVVLGGILIFPGAGNLLRPVGNLDIDTTFGAFQGFTIPPGGSAGPLTFVTQMGVAETQQLLADAGGLGLSVAAQEITGEDGTSFTLRMTDVQAKTAGVIIDYGNYEGRRVERYLVATNADRNVLSVTMKQVMEDSLAISYVADGTGLIEIRGIASQLPSPQVLWIIFHNTVDVDGFPTANFYDPRAEAFDFDNIELVSGDVIRMIYMDDNDGDLIGLREEQIHGTDPNNADTDGDTLGDFFEIKTGWVAALSGNTVFPSPLREIRTATG